MSVQFAKKFDYIYVEHDALNYPLAASILEKFPRSQTISIQNYREVFNPKQQNFPRQKLSPKIILGVKPDHYLYEGSVLTPDFSQQNFFYNAMALNCLYNCSYCYLQGMFNSANLVIFVNEDDFYTSALKRLEELGSMYLSISYDTDLLAIEHLTGFCSKWIELAKKNPDLLIECRTKSVNINSIAELQPVNNFILAWTLSPEIISQDFEKGTPGTTARIQAIKKTIEAGWPVRICLDPLLPVENWQNIYSEFLNILAQEINLRSLHDFCLGSFRINKDYFKKIKKFRSEEWLYNLPYESRDKTLFLEKSLETQICDHLKAELIKHQVSENLITVI